MGGRKILITVTDGQYKALEQEAEARGLCKVSTLARSEIVKAVQNRLKPDGNRKSIFLTVSNYSELAEYVECKKFGGIESFATFAMAQYMAKYPAKAAKKAEPEN